MVTPKDPKTAVVEWATGQSFNNILLLGILVCMAWLGWYTITVGIPQHLKAIQAGYEFKDAQHETERIRTLEFYDRWHGRTHQTTDGEIKVGQNQ